MFNKYIQWIIDNVPQKPSDVYGKCKLWCDKMIEVFPELILTRGHFHCTEWGKREHWWLVTTNGNIIDPTIQQFPSYIFATSDCYEVWDESKPEPVGKCLNCGSYVFPPRTHHCCDECEKENLKYLNSI